MSSSCAQTYQVSQHTRAKRAKVVCAYCDEADAGQASGWWGGTDRLQCGKCKRITCQNWVMNAGCCILCVRKAATLDDNDSSKDAELLKQIPCAHTSQSTAGGLRYWRCHHCPLVDYMRANTKRCRPPTSWAQLCACNAAPRATLQMSNRNDGRSSVTHVPVLVHLCTDSTSSSSSLFSCTSRSSFHYFVYFSYDSCTTCA